MTTSTRVIFSFAMAGGLLLWRTPAAQAAPFASGGEVGVTGDINTTNGFSNCVSPALADGYDGNISGTPIFRNPGNNDYTHKKMQHRGEQWRLSILNHM